MKSLLILLALSAPAFSAVAINLPGSTETASWVFNTTNYSTTTLNSTDLWTAASTTGSASAQLQKVSGAAFLSPSNYVYTSGTGAFRLYDDSPQASLQSIVLQGAISANTMAPTLYYNGGTTGIAANYFRLVDNAAPAYDDYAWQWDLSGLGTITSYEISFSSHIAFTSLQLDTGSSFAQVVPEPSAAVLGVAALGLTFIRRRRA